jgi:hypothetical protein
MEAEVVMAGRAAEEVRVVLAVQECQAGMALMAPTVGMVWLDHLLF